MTQTAFSLNKNLSVKLKLVCDYDYILYNYSPKIKIQALFSQQIQVIAYCSGVLFNCCVCNVCYHLLVMTQILCPQNFSLVPVSSTSKLFSLFDRNKNKNCILTISVIYLYEIIN